MNTNLSYNKKHVSHAFSRAANTYDEAAILQRAVGKCLLKKLLSLKDFKQESRIILDLGSGTGKLTHKLTKIFKNATVIAIDIAIGMLQFSNCNFYQHNIQWTCADVEQLPLEDNCCDLVFSNLMLQWTTDCQHSLKEIWRVLKPNGVLLFSTLGPGTLQELRYCWQQVDHYPHVHSFTSLKNLTHTIKQSLFSCLSVETKTYYRHFHKAIDLMKELKMLGASNLQNNRSRSLMSHKRLQAVFKAYEKFRNEKNMLCATYETYFILAKKCDK